MPRKVQQISDYFTPEGAAALLEGAPRYPTRMAFRIMLKTGLRVSETLAFQRVNLRLGRAPPVIGVRAVASVTSPIKGARCRSRRMCLKASGTWHHFMRRQAPAHAGHIPEVGCRSDEEGGTVGGQRPGATTSYASFLSRYYDSGYGTSPSRTRSDTWSWPGRTTNSLEDCRYGPGDFASRGLNSRSGSQSSLVPWTAGDNISDPIVVKKSPKGPI